MRIILQSFILFCQKEEFTVEKISLFTFYLLNSQVAISCINKCKTSCGWICDYTNLSSSPRPSEEIKFGEKHPLSFQYWIDHLPQFGFSYFFLGSPVETSILLREQPLALKLMVLAFHYECILRFKQSIW